MHFVHRSESTESLAAWSPFECERNKHAQRFYLSAAPEKRELPPPTRLDRTALERTFRQLEGNQSTDCHKKPTAAMNGHLKGVNEAHIKTKLRNEKCENSDYEIQVGREYKKFDKEFITLRVDSQRMLSCSGDVHNEDERRKIADRVQEYLSRVRQFFISKLTHVNSMESTWTLRRRNLALETLKKLYARDVSRMDAWIESVVEAYTTYTL